MRERLTVAFVVLTLGLLAAAALLTGYVQEGQARERVSGQVGADAALLAALVEEQLAQGRAPDLAPLQDLAGADDRFAVVLDGQEPVEVRGTDFDGDDTVRATLPVADGYVLVERAAPTPFDLLDAAPVTQALIVLGVGTVAGLVGYAIARSLSRPFRQLAEAAAALGRGRFDLDLPTSGNPEAQAIARALGGSAGQLRDRLEREQRFALHASHVLRTPLTSLRLSLDELTSDPEVSADARAAAARGLQAVEELDAAAGELVELSRTSAIMAGAEIPLRDVATLTAQRWAAALGQRERGFSAAVEGQHELLFTPGPVETVLDMLLEDTLEHGRGDVRLVLEGDATTLRIRLSGDHEFVPDRLVAGEEPEDPYLRRARLIVEGLGGMMEDRPAPGAPLAVLLPRR
ncbi:HAMP domain-containing protein [Nocardioides nanhaiensis]|uniref:histidine kinase n=1 Tax=Nocardioides nanhaiensis TaxID=1476871 RepID=A0ABP8WY00_9ACTN